MSKRESTFYLVDLFLAIYKIKKYTRAFSSAEALMYDELHWDAVMRELQIVGETISALQKQKILDDQYRKIVDFRNVITHAYFGIDKSVVWDVVINKLPKLENDMRLLCKEQSIDLSEALEDLIEEEKENNHLENVQYLLTLQ